jgi:hypothetical protein
MRLQSAVTSGRCKHEASSMHGWTPEALVLRYALAGVAGCLIELFMSSKSRHLFTNLPVRLGAPSPGSDWPSVSPMASQRGRNGA